jgi:hypothetical protein
VDLSEFSRFTRELYEDAVPGAEILLEWDLIKEYMFHERSGSVTLHIDDLYLTVPIEWCCPVEQPMEIISPQMVMRSCRYGRMTLRIQLKNDMFDKKLGYHGELDDELIQVPANALRELFNTER